MILRHYRHRLAASLFTFALVALAGCQDELVVDGTARTRDLTCSVDLAFVADGGVGRDGIPSLTDPRMVEPGSPDLSYLLPRDRVIGLILDGQPIAIPHNILWWHEIVNLNRTEGQVAVTYCPLTGSSMVFNRSAIDGAELGVSGLLFQANLMMYDRRSGESLWPQMMAAAACGPGTGARLPLVASVEMTWDGWQRLHPNTVAVSGALNTGRNYTRYPYGNFESLSNRDFLGFPTPTPDSRMPPKQRVLGIPLGDRGGLALPFDELDFLGERAVVRVSVGEEPMAVFWDRVAGSAWAFHALADGSPVTLSVSSGRIVDAETGSVWNLAGEATEGPRSGTRLEPVAQAYVAFWGAWANFRPQTQAWSVPTPSGGQAGTTARAEGGHPGTPARTGE